MSKYMVRVHEVHIQPVVIEAKSPEEAIHFRRQSCENGKYENRISRHSAHRAGEILKKQNSKEKCSINTVNAQQIINNKLSMYVFKAPREKRRVKCPYLKYISYGYNYCTRCRNCANDYPTCNYDKDIMNIKAKYFKLNPENYEMR